MQVTQTELSNIFAVSTRAIRDWDKDGCPSLKRGSDSGSTKAKKVYDTAEVIEWYVKRKVEASLDGDLSPLDDEEVRNAQRRQQLAKANSAEADAEIKRIEVGKRKRDVVPRENVEDLFSDVVSGIVQALQRIPYRYVSELGACKTDNDRRIVLKRSMDEVQLEISRLANFDVNDGAD